MATRTITEHYISTHRLSVSVTSDCEGRSVVMVRVHVVIVRVCSDKES